MCLRLLRKNLPTEESLTVQSPLGIIAADQKWFSEGKPQPGTRARVGASDLD
jgi:hypothetical protein